MKKLIAFFILLAMIFSFTACAGSKPREISCEEIIEAYRAEGYTVLYHGHENDTVYNDLGEYCSFEIRDPQNENNYMYVTRYFNENDAEQSCQERQYNLILWLFFGVFGEWRWLHVNCYGDMIFESFDTKMLFPMYKLILQK